MTWWRVLSERPPRETRRLVEAASMHRVLVTGAAGMVATAIRPGLRRTFRDVVLTDMRPVLDAGRNERFIPCDLRDVERVRSLLDGIDGVIHLAGIAKEASAEELEASNVGVYRSLLTLAPRAGVRRIVLASTMHVLGLYRRDEPLSLDSAPRPDSLYAESKVAMERASADANSETFTTAIVRIGCLKARRQDSEPGGWIGERDLTALIALLLVHPRAPGAPWPAVAEHAGDDVGQRALRARLGFRFRCAAVPYLESMQDLERWYPRDPVARTYRGGEFASHTVARRRVTEAATDH